jgi:hypothetical protein
MRAQVIYQIGSDAVATDGEETDIGAGLIHLPGNA